jgi:hypothetical protein
MWKLRTVGRTNSIDVAHICFTIKKLAGCIFIHPLSFPVLKQPFFSELFNGYVQVFGNALQVFEGVGWRHVAATIRAGKTISFLPYFCIDDICKKVKVLWWIIFNLSEKPA